MSNVTIPHFPFNVIDLTHPISPDSPSWDASCGFQHKITIDYESMYDNSISCSNHTNARRNWYAYGCPGTLYSGRQDHRATQSQ